MKQFELQTPISQLFNALKSQFLRVNFFQIDCSEQSNKLKYIFFCDVITLELYCLAVEDLWKDCMPNENKGSYS